MSDLLDQQNRVIISLLARTAFGIEGISRIVTSSKKKAKPKDYLLAYNALDGSKTITEIALLAHVSESTMREVLKSWEDVGIVYRTEKGQEGKHGGNYVGLLKLPLRRDKNKSL